MNKYFLPVYHSELKPWIKWWILKRLNGGQSSLKAVTISSGTLTKVDKSMGLSIKEYYGNTVQNGTPSPQSPVEIKTISGEISFSINNSSYRVDLGEIELCKIGDYKDKIYNDNGTWKVEKNVGKVVLNGTQNITLAGSGTRRFNANYSTLGITNVKEGTSAQDSTLNYRKCDHFAYNSGQTTWGNYYLYSNWLVLLDSGSTIADANALKTWFTSNPTSIYYVLATPTYEIITNTNLISQLNALYEFYVNSSTVTISNNSEIPLEVLLEYYGR